MVVFVKSCGCKKFPSTRCIHDCHRTHRHLGTIRISGGMVFTEETAMRKSRSGRTFSRKGVKQKHVVGCLMRSVGYEVPEAAKRLQEDWKTLSGGGDANGR